MEKGGTVDMVENALTFDHNETLLPVAPDRLRAVWDDIREDVQAIADKCDEPWIAEDVFHEVLVGNAHLWVSPDMTGFVVLRLFATSYSRTLFVWLAHKDREEPAAHYLPQLVEIARSNECTQVSWESPRPWDKILPEAKRGYTFAVDVGGDT